MPETKTLLVKSGERRLDKFLAEGLHPLTRSYIQKLIKDGRVSVNGLAEGAPGRPLKAGDKIVLSLPDFVGLPSSEKNLPLLFEDKDIVVVDKPVGWVVHPAGPHQEGTLVQRLWPKLSPAWAKTVKAAPLHTARPGVVHRLDKGTSGVIVIAKTPAAAEKLSRQFADRKTEKIYWALVRGRPGAESGLVRSTIGRDRRRPHRMSVKDPGRPSELEFKVIARFPPSPQPSPLQGEGETTLLEIHPLTGRTHQIRVQMASLKHPLVGDATYGEAGPGVERPLLHALRLSFDHPRTGKRVSFSAPLPADFREALRKRGFDAFPSKK